MDYVFCIEGFMKLSYRVLLFIISFFIIAGVCLYFSGFEKANYNLIISGGLSISVMIQVMIFIGTEVGVFSAKAFDQIKYMSILTFYYVSHILSIYIILSFVFIVVLTIVRIRTSPSSI